MPDQFFHFSDCVVLLALFGWIYLAFFHGGFWRPLFAEPSPDPGSWPDIDIVIPARNEADSLPFSLPSLLAQNYPGGWRILLVDDHSSDGTAEIARAIAARKNADDRFIIVNAPDLQTGWSGKVAAMQAGLARSTASYVLFTDADIWHPPDNLCQLAARAVEQKLDLVSLMVRLHCDSAAEKLLIPAFVFFFAMLYPFRRVNDPSSHTAAAAGGVMLLRRVTLDARGGFASIKSALIDDCALARLIKCGSKNFPAYGRIELTLARDVRSLRAYPRIDDVWDMIARTAFTQLRYSSLLLGGTVIGMGILFLAPVLALIFGGAFAVKTGLAAWLGMSFLYLPMIRLYRLPVVWALTLPGAALIYIAATIDSARLYWQGKGGQWKGRAQA